MNQTTRRCDFCGGVIVDPRWTTVSTPYTADDLRILRRLEGTAQTADDLRDAYLRAGGFLGWAHQTAAVEHVRVLDMCMACTRGLLNARSSLDNLRRTYAR